MSVLERPLVEAARSGNEAAYGQLVELYWDRLNALARSIVGEADSQDAVQDGLVLAWRRLATLRDSAAFGGWLRKIVVRECLSRARRARWTKPVETLLKRAAPARDLDRGLDVEALLMRLPARQRAVLHMTVVLGMTDREIGKALGVRPATVRAHRRRARESLARAQMQSKTNAMECSL